MRLSNLSKVAQELSSRARVHIWAVILETLLLASKLNLKAKLHFHGLMAQE